MLLDTAYGNSRVRVMKVKRRHGAHDLRELAVAVCFQGDYDESYVAGDNSEVLPIDTMKNTVYALAAAGEIDEPEAFGMRLAEHFLDRNLKLQRVRIDLAEHPWRRIETAGPGAGSVFERASEETRLAVITANRQQTVVEGGLADLTILKSARSSFTGFVRDEFTTLPEIEDGLLGMSVKARWHYRHTEVKFGEAWHAVRRTLVEAFAAHDSRSVNHTLYVMGQAVVDAVEDVAGIHLALSSRHHHPVDVSRFGVDSKGEIFVPADEPHGLIEATVSR